jgi:hypothetical protein
MTNGPMHEAGETARSVIGVFKDNPFVLAMIATNIALLALLYWVAIAAQNERQRSIELMFADRKYETELLSKCVPNQPTP